MQIVEHPCDLWSWGSNFRFMGESFQDYSEFLGKYRKSAHICLSRKIIIASLNYLNTTWKLFNIFYGSMQVYDLNFYSSVFTSGADLERGFICIKVCVWGGGGGVQANPLWIVHCTHVGLSRYLYVFPCICMSSKGSGKTAWEKVFRIIPEFRILRLTFHRKSSSKY